MALIRHICHGTLILTFFILKTARTASRLASTASRWGKAGRAGFYFFVFTSFFLSRNVLHSSCAFSLRACRSSVPVESTVAGGVVGYFMAPR